MKDKIHQNTKPIIKNVFRKVLKPVKKTIVILGVAALGFTTVANTAREVYEEIYTDNTIVDVNLGPLGSFVVANRDTRTATQVYDDMIKVALNVEGMDKVYKNANSMSINEKKAFIQKFSKEVAKVAGVRLQEVVFVEDGSLGTAEGMYVGFNKSIFNYSTNKILLVESLLTTSSLVEALETAFHEVLHFVENTNIQTNRNVDNINFDVHNSFFSYSNEVYYSNFHEITAHLVSAKFKAQLNETYGEKNIDYHYYSTINSLTNLLDEIIRNDIKLNDRENEYYNNLSVRDIINIGIKNTYEREGQEFNEIVLNNSYTMEVVNYAVLDYLFDVSYKDISYGYGAFKSWDLEEKLRVLEDSIEKFKAGNYADIVTDAGYDDYGMMKEDFIKQAQQILAVQMSVVTTVIRYDSLNYSKDLVEKAFYIVQDNLGLIKEDAINFYGLNLLDSINTKTDSNTKNNISLNEELEV